MLFTFIIFISLTAIMFANFPAGFITPQLAPAELKQLDDTIEELEQLKLQKACEQAWSSLDSKLPKILGGMQRLPSKPPAQL